jgi:hypothetical protein
VKTRVENRLIPPHKALTKALAMNVEFLPRFDVRSAKTSEEHTMTANENVKTQSKLRTRLLRALNQVGALRQGTQISPYRIVGWVEPRESFELSGAVRMRFPPRNGCGDCYPQESLA